MLIVASAGRRAQRGVTTTRRPALVVLHPDTMHSPDRLFFHDLNHGLFALPSPSIYTSAEHQVRAQGVALAEQFIDVSLTIADMHTAAGVIRRGECERDEGRSPVR